uniref:Uncharacterized protein n=1 Tax=Rhizophora mucronata TaxID=61149 RepID=A0A2P2R2C7_RHIMU
MIFKLRISGQGVHSPFVIIGVYWTWRIVKERAKMDNGKGIMERTQFETNG